MKQIRATEWYNADKPPLIKQSPHSRGIFGVGR
jgi:peptide deformylase